MMHSGRIKLVEIWLRKGNMSDDKKILNFPISMIEDFEFLTEKEAYYQLRLEAVELLNMIHEGTAKHTPRSIESLYFINATGEKFGFEPLEFTDPFMTNVKKMGYLSEE